MKCQGMQMRGGYMISPDALLLRRQGSEHTGIELIPDAHDLVVHIANARGAVVWLPPEASHIWLVQDVEHGVC